MSKQSKRASSRTLKALRAKVLKSDQARRVKGGIIINYAPTPDKVLPGVSRIQKV